MQIVQAVAVEFHRQVFGLVESENYHVAEAAVRYSPFERANFDVGEVAVVLLDHYFHGFVHVELYHGGVLYAVHVDLYFVFEQVLPFSADTAYADGEVVVVRHVRVSGRVY